MLISIAYGQSTGYLRYDSVRMEKVGGNSELILLNGSRDSVGPLYNMGNGRTRFRTFNGLGIPNRQELQDTAAALRASAKRFGIEDNIQTADRSFDQAGFKFQFPGTVNNNEFIVGDSLSGSTARFQVSTGTTKRPVIAAGNPVSNSAVFLFASADTTAATGTASSSAVRTFGNLFSRRVIVNHTPVTLSSVWGTYAGIEIRARAGDSVKLAPANNDLFNGLAVDLGFQGRSDFPGRKVIQSGSFVTDASSAILGNLDLTTTAGNNFRLRGDYAAVTGFIRDVTNPNGDTLDRFYNFMATGGGALAPHIFKAYNFRGGVISSFVDTLIGIYIDPQSTGVNFNYLGAPLQVGKREDQPTNNQLPHTSAILDLNSTTRGFLLPRMTSTQRTAISSPAHSLVVFDLDSIAAFYYDSVAVAWVKLGTGASGGGGGGITSLNALTGATQTFATGTSGSDFNISSASTTHTFNIPDASASNRGALTSADWISFSNHWSLSGNSVTVGASTGSFLGTTSNNSLRFRTNNTQRMVLDSTGKLWIGVNTSSSDFHLASTSNPRLSVQYVGGKYLNLVAGGSLGVFQFDNSGNFGITAAASINDNGSSGYTQMIYGSTYNSLFGNNMAFNQSDISAQVGVITTASKVGMKVRGASSQTANLFEVQDNSANILARFDANGGLVVNEQGVDTDTRIEGDNDANLFYVDASSDRVGISSSAPTAKLYINGSVGAHKDSITRVTTIDTREYLAIDTANNRFVRIAPQILKGNAALDFPSTGAQQSSDLTITVTGAALGDPVALALTGSVALNNTCFTAWVSSSNTVTVRFNNYTSGGSDPSSATFYVAVIKY